MFNYHDYSGAFAKIGYASHFITDLGNPYHTPMVQIIPLEYVDQPFSQIIFPSSQMILNYKTLHDKYEEMVMNHWSTFYTGIPDRYTINDPTYSAKVHGSNSWVMNYQIVYTSYWHFVKKHNFDFIKNPAIRRNTQNRVMESVRYTRGLVYYVTNGQPIVEETEWNWATDGWGEWQYSATWSGGSGSEYGPLMVYNDGGSHGEHGTDVSLSGGSTQSSVWKTFTDPSGIGWNTITFSGLMTASDVPSGRWMTIDVNNNRVFGGTASQSPPGNGVPFEIRRSFTQSPTVTVKISNGQSPAWGPRFAMHYYSVKLSRESTASLLTTQDSLFVIPDRSGLITNGTSQAV